MAEFVCRVGDASGRVFKHTETAQSKDEARQKLADQGLYVFSVSSHVDLLKQLTRARGAIRAEDFLVFNQQFNTLVRAGLPILKALDLLAERAAAPKLRPILVDVRPRPERRIALRSACGARLVSARLHHGDFRGRAKRRSFGSARTLYRVSAHQHQFSQQTDHDDDLPGRADLLRLRGGHVFYRLRAAAVRGPLPATGYKTAMGHVDAARNCKSAAELFPRFPGCGGHCRRGAVSLDALGTRRPLD